MKKRKRQDRKMRHRRYRKISFKICDNRCPNDGTPLKIILFNKDEKFRDHAITHMIIQYEDEIEAWKQVLSGITVEDINKCRKALEELGCPKFKMGSFPCASKKEVIPHDRTFTIWCNLYEECTGLVKEMENEYLNIAFKIIKEGLNIPRYACCLDGKGRSLWIVPNRPLTAQAYLLNKNLYNLSTCYSPRSSRSWQEVRDHVKRIIEIQSQNKPIWCKPEMWRSGLSSMGEAFQKAIEMDGGKGYINYGEKNE